MAESKDKKPPAPGKRKPARIGRRIQRMVGRPRKRGQTGGETPPRAEQAAQNVAAIKEQAIALFGEVLPLGPEAAFQLVSLHSRLAAAAPTEPGTPRVLDLLLRLVESIGDDSSFAKILRGAAGAITQHGLEAVRFEDIIERAGVSPRTFYQFFRNKTEAATALADIFFDVLLELCRRSAERGETPEERLENAVRTVIGALGVIEGLAPILISEAFLADSPIAALYERFRERTQEVIAPIHEAMLGVPPTELWWRVHLRAVLGAALELRIGSDSSPEEIAYATATLLELLTPGELARRTTPAPKE